MNIRLVVVVVVVLVSAGVVSGRQMSGRTAGLFSVADQGREDQSMHHLQGQQGAVLTTTAGGEKGGRNEDGVKHSGYQTLDLFIDGDDDNEHHLFTTQLRKIGRELEDLDNSMHVTDEKERDRTNAPLSRIPKHLLTSSEEERDRTNAPLSRIPKHFLTTDQEERDRTNAPLSRIPKHFLTSSEEESDGSQTVPFLPYTADEGERHALPTPRFLGIDVGDESTNFQAGMWLLGLVAVLASAIPAVFLDTTLGFRRRRRRSQEGEETGRRRRRRRRRRTGTGSRQEGEEMDLDSMVESVLNIIETANIMYAM
ncbi:hypothetical protein Pcinc_036279 [Petrolisthes cinctipes]|uniref:Uncharacterized protein n=1 Tax=Petrolisthes cinctipes TaxID=88211 RepID=A0AAE1EMI1_PETCI|nr:hypothetical protein Pcinc_036279 [Petrolisthes cinctipes]